MNINVKRNFERAQIIIYGILGLYEKAVDLSLKIYDDDLAKRYASKCITDSKLTKKLWMKIAKHILGVDKSDKFKSSVNDKNKVEKVLELLHDFDVLMKEQDINF